MRTEAKRSFNYGFLLNETELRRFRETISAQMDQVCPARDYHVKYELKFHNGAISEPAEIDEILDLENHGSSRITRLKARAEMDETCIEIKFSDPSSESVNSEQPIEYRIAGDNKDWVFVTSSKIEERINKASTIRPARLIESKPFFPVSFAIFMMIGMIVLSYLQYIDTDYLQKLDAIVTGTINPVKAIVEIEYLKAERKSTGLESPMLIFAMVWGPAIILFGMLQIVKYVWPSYNFLWGDYMTVYRRRTMVGRVVFASTLGSIALGVAGNMVYSILFG